MNTEQVRTTIGLSAGNAACSNLTACSPIIIMASIIFCTPLIILTATLIFCTPLIIITAQLIFCRTLTILAPYIFYVILAQ